MTNTIYKSNRNKVFTGVCGGLSEYYNIHPTKLRIIFILFSAVTFWIYIALILLMPSLPDLL